LITPALEIHSLTERSVEFEWTTIDHNQFDGYKLVISKDDTRPSYPEDGYMTYITKAETHTFQVNIGDIPQRGDFKSIEQNVIYHATITALYGDDKLTSESVSFILSE